MSELTKKLDIIHNGIWASPQDCSCDDAPGCSYCDAVLEARTALHELRALLPEEREPTKRPCSHPYSSVEITDNAMHCRRCGETWEKYR